jgi:AraC-like DNA-binding protein
MNTRTSNAISERSSPLRTIDLDVLSNLFDHNSDIAFFIKDAEGCYVAVNDSLVRRHGFKDKSSVIGRHPCDICVGDFGRLPSDQDAKVLATGRPLIEHLEMQLARPNEPVWCLTTKIPICDSDGKVVGIAGFSKDLRGPACADDVPSAFAIALDYLKETLSDEVTPAWLAQQANITPQKLSRLSKRIFDLTPTQLITKFRIAEACRLLDVHRNKTIADVGLACGFYDQSAFARAFRSATGVTPTQFRKQQRDSVNDSV